MDGDGPQAIGISVVVHYRDDLATEFSRQREKLVEACGIAAFVSIELQETEVREAESSGPKFLQPTHLEQRKFVSG
jgi:hypothetical protein